MIPGPSLSSGRVAENNLRVLCMTILSHGHGQLNSRTRGGLGPIITIPTRVRGLWTLPLYISDEPHPDLPYSFAQSHLVGGRSTESSRLPISIHSLVDPRR